MARFVAREFAFQWSAILAVVLAVLVAVGEPASGLGTVIVVLLCGALIRELWLGWESTRSARAVADELADLPAEPDSLRFPRTHLALPPLMLFARTVRRRRGVVFHREQRRIVRLDVYEPRAPAAEGELRPAVIQVHGGGWILGSRLEQGIPLLNHMAAHGWVGFNVDYWLSPRATMPDHVIDVKRAIAWVRAHAEEYGIDPRRICITGGSAGGHLTALAALTANDPVLQPGFEDADTSVAAAVPFYGVYDFTDPDRIYAPGIRDWLLPRVIFKRPLDGNEDAYRASSPTHRVHEGAPPFLVFHGENDTLVPVADARTFVKRLEGVSRNPVRYVELPGAEHAFDIFPSLRTARVVEGIERVLRATVATASDQPGNAPASTSGALTMLSSR
jgi:acetyl esterase/lipase